MSRESFSLDVEGEVELPVVNVLTGRGVVLGQSDSGKSNTVSVVAERLLENKFPFLIVDTEGEYFGLKERYEVLHAGADEECDVQVGPEHAEKIAALALEQGIPVVLDVSGYIDEGRVRGLVRDVVHHLFVREQELRRPFLLVVEEAHEFVPEQRSQDELGEVLLKVAKRGRKRGLGLLVVSQRAANLKKTVIGQASWLVFHRVLWRTDTRVVREFFDDLGMDGKIYQREVTGLGDGEAFLYAKWEKDDMVRRIQVERKETFDAGKTPGLEDYGAPDLKTVSQDLVDELRDITRERRRKQDRVSQLESEVEKRNEVIEELRVELDRARDMTDMAQRFTQALTSATGETGEELSEKLTEIREEKNSRIRELEVEKSRLEESLETAREKVRNLTVRVEELERYEEYGRHYEEAREGIVRVAEALGVDAGSSGERLREKLGRERNRVEELKKEVRRLREAKPLIEVELGDEFQERLDFLKHGAVSEAISEAAAKTSYREEHAWDAATILAEQGECTLDDMSPLVEVARNSLSNIMARLRDQGIVKKRKEGKTVFYDLNVEGLEQIVLNQRRKEELERTKVALRERREEVRNSGA